MAEFSALTTASAELFVAEQSYANRIHVSLMGKHGGFQPVPVLSAGEFVKVTTGLNPVVSVDALSQWVAEKLRDRELAQAIRTECEPLPLFEQAQVACGLVAQRLAEAQEVLGVTGAAPIEA